MSPRRRLIESSGTQSVVNSFIAGSNVQIGSVTGDLAITLERPEYHLRWLAPEEQHAWVPDRQRAPSSLLDARREVVPFRVRPLQQERLRAWRDADGPPLSVRLVHGAGGRGKTRLANTFARESYVAGWRVAEALSRGTDNQMVTGLRQAGPPEHLRTLVVVDYAERWEVSSLARLITDLVPYSSMMPVRVLLLARSTMDVWDSLVDQLDRQPVDLPDPLELPDFTADLEERRSAFNEAVVAFRHALGTSDVAVSPPVDLDHPSYGLPLTLHMTALASVCAAAANESPPRFDDLSRYLLRHERRTWPSADVSRAQANDLVFLASLFGPLADDGVAHALLRQAKLVDGDAAARQLVRWHDRAYPDGTSEHPPTVRLQQPSLTPLRPDRFGEDFVAEQLANEARAAAMLAQLAEAGTLDAFAWRRCLTVLAAVVDRHEKLRAILWILLKDHSHLAYYAGAQLVRTVITYAPRDVAVEFCLALPPVRTDLARPSAELLNQVIRTSPDDTPKATLAQLRVTHSIQLTGIGDFEGALVASRDAVAVFRYLVQSDKAVRGDDVNNSDGLRSRHLYGLGSSLVTLGGLSKRRG